MNNYFPLISSTRLRYFILGLMVCVFVYSRVEAQSQKTYTKIPVNMSVSYAKINGLQSVRVHVSQNTADQNSPVAGPINNLYLNKVKKHNQKTGLGWIGNYNLDHNGEALFVLKDSLKNCTKDKHVFTFISRMISDLQYQDTEERLIINDADLTICLSEKDSKKTATARLVGWKDSITNGPIEGVGLKLFIKNKSGLFPIGKEAFVTNTRGEVNAEIVLTDQEDNCPSVLVARLDNHERFGTIESSIEMPGKTNSVLLIWLCLTVVMLGIITYYVRSKNK